MSFNSKVKYNQKAIAATAVTAVAAASTVGTAASNVVQCQLIAPGTILACNVSMVVKTTNLTLTPKWQGSNDGVTFVDLYALNSAANVATAAGTGSNVTTARTLILNGQPPFKVVRVVFLTAGATAHATDDTYALNYNWIEQG